MKKLSFIVLLSVLLIVLPLIHSAFAVEASVGVSTWYAWWKADDMELKPALLFGPVASLRFSDSWSLSGVFLYGKFKSDTGDSMTPKYIKRYDSDVSLNYNINRYFKIFAGGKYMGFTWYQPNEDGTHWSIGPGVGLGSTIPLTESLYLLLNVSGTYSRGRENAPPRDQYSTDQNTDITEISFNTNMSFAYYIKSASTSINLGFRYQLVKTDYEKNTEDQKDQNFIFFGPTLAAVYSF